MRYTLRHELNSIIYTGTKRDCELALLALTTYGVRADKFEIVEDPGHKWMSIPTREAVLLSLEVDLRTTMFGDGLEYEYIRDGLTMTGLTEMTDDELYTEFMRFNRQFLDVDCANDYIPGSTSYITNTLETEYQTFYTTLS